MNIDLQSLYPKLVHLMLDTVFVVDSDNQIIFVSDACESLLGYRADELIGTTITDYMHPDDLEATRNAIRKVMDGKPHIDFRNRYLRKDGDVVYILWSARWHEEERVRIGVARNVTDLVEAEAELRYLAHHDPLTKLTNRSLFYDRLKTGLAVAQRQQTGLALLFVDIDRFKHINDAYGHAVGDEVLCTVARRLEDCVRDTDTVARMGGDEFIVLLTDIPSADAVSMKMTQIRDTMSAPLGAEFDGIDMPSCSIGVAVYPLDGEDAESLMSYADGDMYRMKSSAQ